MKLAELLQRKGGEAVTAPDSITINAAIKHMHEGKVGSVVIISEQNYPLGIFTERDVMRLCAEGKAMDFDKLVIRDYMTRDLTLGSPNDTVDSVLNLMTQGRFRRLPIVVDNQVVGVLSIGDLVKAKLEETEHDAEALREYIAS